MIGEKLIGQIVIVLLAIAILTGTFFWFKSSYERSVIAKHEAGVAKTIKREEIKDANNTSKLVAKRATARQQTNNTFTGIRIAGMSDAQNHPVAADCKLSAIGLQLTNRALATANGADGVYDSMSDPSAVKERNAGRSELSTEGRGGESVSGVQATARLPEGMDTGRTKESAKDRIKRLWSTS